MFKNILVGYDGSKGAKLALHRAIMIAKNSGASITALWVSEPLPKYTDLPGEPEEAEEAAEDYFEMLKKEIEEASKSHQIPIKFEMRHGHPAKTIVKFADEGGFDLIAVGHSDHSELWGRLLGDTADRISDHAHCSVLIVKG